MGCSLHPVAAAMLPKVPLRQHSPPESTKGVPGGARSLGAGIRLNIRVETSQLVGPARFGMRPPLPISSEPGRLWGGETPMLALCATGCVYFMVMSNGADGAHGPRRPDSGDRSMDAWTTITVVAILLAAAALLWVGTGRRHGLPDQFAWRAQQGLSWREHLANAIHIHLRRARAVRRWRRFAIGRAPKSGKNSRNERTRERQRYEWVAAVIVVAGLFGAGTDVSGQAIDTCSDCHLITGECIVCGKSGGTGWCLKTCDDSGPLCVLSGGACGGLALAGPAGTAPVLSWPARLEVPQGWSSVGPEVFALFGDRLAVDRKTIATDGGRDDNEQEWAVRRRCDGAVVYRHYGLSTARLLRAESSVLVL